MTDPNNEEKAALIVRQLRLGNMVLDMLYKQVRLKQSNYQIQRVLQQKNLPPISHDQLNQLRDFFKWAEHEKPARMAEFRKRLNLG